MIETIVVEPYKLIANAFCDFRRRSAIYYCNTESGIYPQKIDMNINKDIFAFSKSVSGLTFRQHKY